MVYTEELERMPLNLNWIIEIRISGNDSRIIDRKFLSRELTTIDVVIMEAQFKNAKTNFFRVVCIPRGQSL